MSQLLERGDGTLRDWKDVGDETPSYCIVGRESNPCCKIDDNNSTALVMQTLKKCFASLLTDTYRHRWNWHKLGTSILRWMKPVVFQNAALEGSLQNIEPKRFHREVLDNGRHPINAEGLSTWQITIVYAVICTGHILH